MRMLVNAVTTSVIINVTVKVIATAAPVESSSSDSLSTVDKIWIIQYNYK